MPDLLRTESGKSARPTTDRAGKPDGLMAIERHYTRHLPHVVPAGFPIFVTWNLKGAMPKAAVEGLLRERERLRNQTPRAGETDAQRRLRESKLMFAAADRFLDLAADGPMHLKDPQSAGIVEDAILFGAGDRYDLFAWCVLSNHVHVLLTPRQALVEITRILKGYTAYRINRLHDACGREFWQDESYDHWSRDEDEMFRIIDYIEKNPVAAGLCRSSEDWPWSSGRFRRSWPPGEAYNPVKHGLPSRKSVGHSCPTKSVGHSCPKRARIGRSRARMPDLLGPGPDGVGQECPTDLRPGPDGVGQECPTYLRPEPSWKV